MIDNILNEVLKALIVAIVPVVAAYVIAWLRHQVRIVRTKVNDSQYALVLTVIDKLVKAAEQAGIGGIIEDIGTEKKAYVLDALQKFCDEHGIHISVIELEALVEYAIHQGWQEVQDNTVQPNGLSAYTPDNQS